MKNVGAFCTDRRSQSGLFENYKNACPIVNKPHHSFLVLSSQRASFPYKVAPTTFAIFVMLHNCGKGSYGREYLTSYSPVIYECTKVNFFFLGNV